MGSRVLPRPERWSSRGYCSGWTRAFARLPAKSRFLAALGMTSLENAAGILLADFEVGVDPLFELTAAVVRRVEAHAERVLGFFPGHSAADPQTRQGKQREGNFEILSGGKIVRTAQRHATRTDFDAGRGQLFPFVQLERDLGHHRDAHITAE